MVKVLIWGLGPKYNLYINAIKYCEVQGEIEIVGVTDRKELYTCLDGYPFIPLEEICSHEIDYIAITPDSYQKISQQAVQMGFSEEQLILARVFALPGFRFNKYRELLDSKVSIIPNNCWGGVVYHTLGMKCLSPFINMFMGDLSFFRLLNNLEYYIHCKLQFKRFEHNPVLKSEYPVCGLDDVELHFNHSTSMDEVEEKWYERVERLNWNNLFVMMMYSSGWPETLERFDKLNYKKKIAFLSFDSSQQSTHSLRTFFEKDCGDINLFWKCVNGIPQGIYQDYDLIDLLLTGKASHSRYYLNNKYK